MERDEEKNISDPSKQNRTKSLVLDFRKYLEKEGYVPSSINTFDGAIRGFYSSILGKERMINVGNYKYHHKTVRKDLIPTIDELREMLEVCNLKEKFRIIFVTQTGMRISDALNLKVGDIKRELDRGRSPLAIKYVLEKEGETVGERITFLASDGVEILKKYLSWREKKGENLTEDSLYFCGK
ncbi:hypothetical protein AKJ43_02280 [candidate division MSBL1 archaeon SCGC-AAA261D19]|uniref:Tyr recombinase domain-containing protein n=1 Tax=candidate division MSBL1 archaeon SCGC-AAA261D19 TaxID=1698273 RepID=A0A133V6X8_9EURY|nr:hypothetical protein AKJ43_02280 [candidate division MSBL1 archaeon SCGC-AAA261D19]